VKRVTKTGRFAAAFGIDIADEVDGLTGEIGKQRRCALAGQGGNQIGLAGLARAKDPGAHRPLAA
jgi:hypothetical protein